MLCVGVALSLLTTVAEHIVYKLVIPRVKEPRFKYWLHTSQVRYRHALTHTQRRRNKDVSDAFFFFLQRLHRALNSVFTDDKLQTVAKPEKRYGLCPGRQYKFSPVGVTCPPHGCFKRTWFQADPTEFELNSFLFNFIWYLGPINFFVHRKWNFSKTFFAITCHSFMSSFSTTTFKGIFRWKMKFHLFSARHYVDEGKNSTNWLRCKNQKKNRTGLYTAGVASSRCPLAKTSPVASWTGARSY